MMELPPHPNDTPLVLMLEQARNGGWLVKSRTAGYMEPVVVGAFTNAAQMLADLSVLLEVGA